MDDLTFKDTLPLIDRCILCGQSGRATEVLASRLRDDRSDRFRVARCLHCGHVQTTPLPSEAEEAAYYNRDAQPKALWGDNDYLKVVRARAQTESERRSSWLADEIGPGQGQKVLDIGSGYGFFVDTLTTRGFRATGIDVSESRFAFAQREMKGVFLRCELDAKFADAHKEEFAAVTCFHVLEHVRYPEQYVRHALSLLRSDGVLLIEVPNVNDELSYDVPPYADHLWQLAHLSYFDAARMKLLFQRAGATRFVVKGKQRYGLRHLLQWTDRGAPDLETRTEAPTNALFDRIETLYRLDRERALACDTLVATIRR